MSYPVITTYTMNSKEQLFIMYFYLFGFKALKRLHDGRFFRAPFRMTADSPCCEFTIQTEIEVVCYKIYRIFLIKQFLRNCFVSSPVFVCLLNESYLIFEGEFLPKDMTIAIEEIGLAENALISFCNGPQSISRYFYNDQLSVIHRADQLPVTDAQFLSKIPKNPIKPQTTCFILLSNLFGHSLHDVPLITCPLWSSCTSGKSTRLTNSRFFFCQSFRQTIAS